MQSHMPWLWQMVEWGNDILFMLRFGRQRGLPAGADGFSLAWATKDDVAEMERFFARQPKEAFEFFKPHEFDAKTLEKLVRRRSFLMFLVRNETKELVGYGFVRSFFNGKGFLGKMTDRDCRGKGVGTLIVRSAMQVCTAMNLRMLESISPDNKASMCCSQAACDVTVLEQMADGTLLIEDRPKL